MEEVFAIYNDAGKIIGAATRAEAHKKGLWHTVVHCWAVSRDEHGIWFYFQQRSRDKKDSPGLYDLTSTGHVDAAELHQDAVIRETKEEVGVDLDRERLYYLGSTRESVHAEDYFDREICQIYLYEMDQPGFTPGEEVSRVVKISKEELEKKELKGAKEVTAYTMNGKKFTIRDEEWCRHDGEYKKLVRQALDKCFQSVII